MKLGTVEKQPGEVESYTLDYSDDLDAGDNVQSATLLSVSPTGLIVDQVFVFDPRVRFFASGGVDKTNYKVTFKITTADGRELEDEVTIKVKEE